MRRSFAFAAVLTLAAGTILAAQEPIATDRPDFVESSMTVGTRVFQFETSAAAEWVSAGNGRTIATPTLFRYGITPTVELRFETDGYLHASADGVESEQGLADAAIGFKWHALDGEGARPSVAFLAHGDLPTGSEAFRTDGVRPSLRVVGEWELPGGFGLGLMPGAIYDVDGTGDRQWAASFGAVVGKPVSESLRFFVEYAGEQLPLGNDLETTSFLDVGTALFLSNDVQLDLSTRVGLTDSAADHALAIGFSRRFR